MKRPRKLPYWLRGGSETCEVCTQAYVVEMEYRCWDCDRGVCEQCAVFVRATRQTYCAECRHPEEPA